MNTYPPTAVIKEPFYDGEDTFQLSLRLSNPNLFTFHLVGVCRMRATSFRIHLRKTGFGWLSFSRVVYTFIQSLESEPKRVGRGWPLQRPDLGQTDLPHHAGHVAGDLNAGTDVEVPPGEDGPGEVSPSESRSLQVWKMTNEVGFSIHV